MDLFGEAETLHNHHFDVFPEDLIPFDPAVGPKIGNAWAAADRALQISAEARQLLEWAGFDPDVYFLSHLFGESGRGNSGSSDNGGLMTLSTSSENTGPDIIVIGTQPETYYDSGGGGGGGGGGELTDTDDSITTGDQTDSTPGDELDHAADCSTVAGAADQIRDKIVSTQTDNSQLTTSHQKIEYGTLIVANGDGTYGAVNDTIYSDSSPNYVRLTDNMPLITSSIVGIIHNHAGSPSGDYFTNIAASYPSEGDWQTLDYLVKTYELDATMVSIWIIDAWGNMREFKYSDMAKYMNMSDSQMRDPNNLPPKSNVDGCNAA